MGTERDGVMPERWNVVTWPNLMTLLGLVTGLGGLFVMLYSIYYHGHITQCAYICALVAYGFVMFFDFLDGKVARWTNAESRFGRVFDPIVDKINFWSYAVLLLAYQNIVDGLEIDLIVNALVIAALYDIGSTIERFINLEGASKGGKWKAASFCVAILALLLGGILQDAQWYYVSFFAIVAALGFIVVSIKKRIPFYKAN